MASARPVATSLAERVAFAWLLLFAAALPLSRSVAEAGALLALVLWLAHRVTHRVEVRHPHLWVAAAAFFVLSVVSSIASLEPALSLPRMKTVALVMCAVVVAEMVHDRVRLIACLAAVAVGAVISLGVVGVSYARGIGVEVRVSPESAAAQAGLRDGDVVRQVNGLPVRTVPDLQQFAFGSHPERSEGALWSRDTSGPIPALRLDIVRTELEHPLTLRVPVASLQSLDLSDMRVARPLRARGNLKHPPTFAVVLTFASLLMLGVTLFGAELGRWRIALAAAALLAGAGVFLTVSRAAIAALLLATALAVWLATSNLRLRFVALAALTLVVLLLPLWFRGARGLDWLGARDPGTDYRLLMWKDGARLALAHPLLGIGMDSAQERWPELGLAAYRRFGYHSHFHSAPLALAAERGLPALFAWLALVVLAGRSAWRAFRAPAEDRLRQGAALGVLSCLVAYVLLSCVYNTVGDATMAMASWFVIGLAFAVAALQSDSQTSGVQA